MAVVASKDPMEFILTGLGNWAPAWELIKGGVKEAEKCGFWGAVFPDQYMWDLKDLGVESYENIDLTLDTWIELGYLAAETRKIHLGTWVTPIPLRPPGVLAKTVSTLDVLSGGRSLLGVGAGSTQRLFEGYSQWDLPSVRVDRTREGIELILKLWHDKKTDYDGSYYRAKGAVLEPKPVQKPHPPLLFGGAGRRMLKLAGRYADICYIPPWSKVPPEESRKLVLAEAKLHGRRDDICFAEAYTPLGPDQSYNRDLYLKEVQKAASKGFTYFVTAFNLEVAPWEVNESTLQGVTESYLSTLHDFSKIIMPRFLS
jgi:alkanesulfonate monooxygenase SsuD/methylene tetrahydromethanopterin reductase-like flavin-dependent oxidoreductase (luciferase family)